MHEFSSFLVLQMTAITKWRNTKDSKDNEQYPTPQNKSKPTMISASPGNTDEIHVLVSFAAA